MSDTATTTEETSAEPASASTEIALKPFSELATLDLSQQFLTDYESLDPEAQGELVQELLEDGIRLHMGHLTRVTVPTGGITQFQIVDEDGIEQAVRELIGVVIGAVDRRSMWVKKFGEADSESGPPDCASRDMITGDGLYGVGSELHPSGDCETCPMNARGSAGTGTQASKCKTQKLLFLATTQEVLPMILTVPPASLGAYTKFRVGGAIKRKRGAGRGPKELKITLAKKKNATGVEYGEIVFTATGREFNPDEQSLIGEFKRRMAVMIKENQETLDAMAAASAAMGAVSSEDEVEPGAVPYDEAADEILPDGVPVGGSGGSRKR